jgi:hypothetical protein
MNSIITKHGGDYMLQKHYSEYLKWGLLFSTILIVLYILFGD